MTPDESLWQHLEADFARVLGETPKPEGPAPLFDGNSVRWVWSVREDRIVTATPAPAASIRRRATRTARRHLR